MFWFGLNSVEYSGQLRDFNTPLFKLLCSISALVSQAWIVYDFFNGGNEKGFIRIPSLELFKSKPKVVRNDNTNKKRKNAGMC